MKATRLRGGDNCRRILVAATTPSHRHKL